MTEQQMLGASLRQLRQSYVLLGHLESMVDGRPILETIAAHRQRIAALLALADPRWEKRA